MKTNFVSLLLLVLTIQVSSNQLFGQTEGCQFSANAFQEFLKTTPQESMAGCCQPDPGGSTEPPVKFISVNIHFLLSESETNPGNFTEDNGYDYAEKFINEMNDNWKKNYQSLIYLEMDTNGNAVPPDYPPKGIQVALKGVYFDRDEDLYEEAQGTNSDIWGNDDELQNPLGQNGNAEFNIYFVETPAAPGSGVAGWFNGQPLFVIFDAFAHHNAGGGSYDKAKTANHEIGHLLGLDHTFSCGDACNGIDINSPKECKPLSNNPSSCTSCLGRWGNTNNMMNYSSLSHALTPCQIDKMHQTIEDNYCNYIDFCQYNYTICEKTCCGGLPGIIVKGLWCHPPSAFFDMETSLEACDPNNIQIWMDGRGSWTENEHVIEITQVFPFGSTNNTIKSFTGKIDRVDLASYCNYQFEIGGIYRVKLTTKNNCGEDEQTSFVTVNEAGDCSLDCLEVVPGDCTESGFICTSCWDLTGVAVNPQCINWEVEVIHGGSYNVWNFQNVTDIQLSHGCGATLNICVELCDLPEPCEDLVKCFTYREVGHGFNPGGGIDGHAFSEVSPPINPGKISPNPFRQSTQLMFDLPAAANATLEVFDLNGRLVFSQQGNFQKGQNAVELNQLPEVARGLLIYRISTDQEVLSTGRMIRVK